MVLRPRLPHLNDEQKKAALKTALLKAFKYYDRDYDFDFDFSTEDKIVCSELIFRAYDGMLNFEREKIALKEVVSPLGIARKWDREFDPDKDQLEFILFLDKVPGENHAYFSTLDAARKSVTRPKAFNE